MIEFFVISVILFSILLAGNIYYDILSKKQNSKIKSSPRKNSKAFKKGYNFFYILLPVLLILLLTIGVSLGIVKLITQNIYIFYMGLLTFVMLALSFYSIQKNKNKLIISILLSLFLIELQIYLKMPLFGGLLSTAGYIGAVNYIIYKKTVSPKIIILFLSVYAIYDFITVFITPFQPALASKTINDIFPSSIIFGNTILGLGDVLFTLIMTSFIRTYFGLFSSIITAFLLSLPLFGLGIYLEIFSAQKIAVPYLVLTTPVFLTLLFILSKKGFNLK